MQCSLDHAFGRNITSFSVQLAVGMLSVTSRISARNEDKQTPLKLEPEGGGGQPGAATSRHMAPTWMYFMSSRT